MEVSLKNCILIVTSLLFLSACSNGNKGAGKITNNEKLGDECQGNNISGQYIVNWKSGKISTVKVKDRDELISKIINPNYEAIEFVEQDFARIFKPYDIFRQLPRQESNDVFDNWGVENINAEKVWQANVRGAGIKVAIIDNGVDVEHPQLNSQIAVNENEIYNNGIDDDGNGLVDDYYGYNFGNKNANVAQDGDHGTHVAGIVAAFHEDKDIVDDLVQGTAPEAQLIPVKFIYIAENGQPEGTTSDAIASIDYAVSRGAQIINASWGGACSLSLRNRLDQLDNENVLFVTAAGNGGNDGIGDNIDVKPAYPGAFRNVNLITVGAIGEELLGMPVWSNWGEETVHLFAPGVDIDSTLPANSHGYRMGTSMATPYVAGAAALIWSHRPQATATEIKQALMESVIIDSRYRNITSGRLDAEAALNKITELLP